MTSNHKFSVLDKGSVELLGMFGDELTIVNAARVSFGAAKSELEKKDVRLIKYLYKHKHMSPFRHLMFRFRIKAPEFVMRQFYKHVIGCETTSNDSTKDHAWNEISGRYKPVTEYYVPSNWREQSKDNKQASCGSCAPEIQEKANQAFSEVTAHVQEVYQQLLDMGVAKEQARIVLPLNQYTEVIWTASAQAVLNFIELRDEPFSQWEIREYAIAFRRILEVETPKLSEIWFASE
jgi:thymidylate synthase (FAD)